MEGSIVHYNYGTLVKGRQKLLRKPKFKKATVHRSAILKWCKDLASHFSGYNQSSYALKLSVHSGDLPEYHSDIRHKIKSFMRTLQRNKNKTVAFFRHPLISYT